jgi:hypothetical protein
MKLRNTILSIYAATLLVGCGSSSTQSTQTTKESKSILCQDTNLNAKCESSELIKELDSWEDYSKSTKNLKALNEVNNSPILYEGKDNLRLVASSKSDRISPLTTLIFNEITNNINVNTEAEALAYLKEEFSFSENLSGEDISKLSKRLIQLSKEEGFSYENLNSFVSTSLKEKKFDIENIIQENSLLSKSFKANKKDESLTWEQSDHDEDPVSSSVKGDTAVVASKYHNSLTLIDTKNETVSHNGFSRIEGDRFTIDSITGASEHTISNVELSSNEKDLYVLIKPANDVLQEKDKTWGLFKTQIVDSKINNFDNVNTKRIDNKNITDISLSKDGSTLIAYDNEYDSLITYDKDLNDLSKYIDLSRRSLFDISISNDNKYIYASVKDSGVNKLLKYDLSTQTLVKELILPYSGNIVNSFEKDEIIIYKKEDNKTIFLVDTKDLKIVKNVNVDIIIKTLSLSEDMLFVTSDTQNEVLAYDLSKDEPKVEFSVEPKELVQTIFATSSKLFLPLHEKGEIEIVEYYIDGLSQNKIKKDLEDLNADTINHGMAFEAVLFDLQLNQSALRGSGSSITWSVSDNLKNNIVTKGIDIGKIERPSVNEDDIKGQLIATIKQNFREKELVKTKEFDITLRQEPKYLEVEDKMTLGSLDGGGYVFFIAMDGLKVTTQLYGKNTNGNGFKVFTINKNTNKLETTVQGIPVDSNGIINEDTNKNVFNKGQLYDGVYSSSEGAGMVMKDDKVLFVLKTPIETLEDKTVKVLSNGALMTYSISDETLAENGQKAKKLGDEVVFPGFETNALFSSLNGNNLAVLIKGTFDNVVSKKVLIYDVTNLEEPILLKTVNDIDASKIALNDDASYIYGLNGDIIEKYDVNTSIKVAKIEQADAFSITTSSSNIFIGDEDGNLGIYDENLNLQTKYVSGYGRYGGRTSGEGHAFGRVEDIQVINNKVYMGNKYRGLITLDISNLSTIKEESVYRHENYRRGFVNKDASIAIPFYYYERARDDIGYIDLNK